MPTARPGVFFAFFALVFGVLATEPAEPFDAMDFEHFDRTPVGGFSYHNDYGGTSESEECGVVHFLFLPWKATLEDSSELSFYAQSTNGVPRPASPGLASRSPAFEGQPNTRYLRASTEGGTLYRSIHAIRNHAPLGEASRYDVGEPEELPRRGLFADSLVQFTYGEFPPDAEPTADDPVKFVVWATTNGLYSVQTNVVYGDDVETNVVTNACLHVMVSAARYAALDDGGVLALERQPGAFNYALTNLVVEEDAWYRLTVAALPSPIPGADFPLFQVYVNGQLGVSDAGCIVDGLDVLAGFHPDVASDLASNTFFPSLYAAESSLSAMGVRGEAAWDDYAVGDQRPEFLPEIKTYTFTLAWTAGVASIEAYVGEYYDMVDGLDELDGSAGSVDVAVEEGDRLYVYYASAVSRTVYADRYRAGEWAPAGVAAEDLNENADGGDALSVRVVAPGGSLTVSAVEVTGIEFTLSFGADVSVVAYAVEGVNPRGGTALSGVPIELEVSDRIVFSPTAAATPCFGEKGWTWSAATGDVTGENGVYEVKADAFENAAVTVSYDDSKAEVTAETAPADLGVTGGAFAEADAGQLARLVDWAYGKQIPHEAVNAMAFGTPYSQLEKAYLLNCDNEADAVAAAQAAFRIPSIAWNAQTQRFDVQAPVGDFNGTVVIKWAEAPAADAWQTGYPEDPSKAFFKAFLEP